MGCQIFLTGLFESVQIQMHLSRKTLEPILNPVTFFSTLWYCFIVPHQHTCNSQPLNCVNFVLLQLLLLLLRSHVSLRNGHKIGCELILFSAMETFSPMNCKMHRISEYYYWASVFESGYFHSNVSETILHCTHANFDYILFDRLLSSME